MQSMDEGMTGAPFDWLVPRPQDGFQHLPAEYKWEFTRRHPYYQVFWNSAAIADGLEEPLASAIRFVAAVLLSAIDVSRDTVAPNTEWAAIDPGPAYSVWKTGAVKRTPLKGLVVALVQDLPQDSLSHVAGFLDTASNLPHGDQQAKYHLLRALSQDDWPGSDGYLPALVVTISPRASERAIGDAIKAIVRSYRKEHGIPDPRIRIDKFSDYLSAWDFREGWVSGYYDRSKEMKLKEIAAKSGRSTATICDHYKSAFQLITGVEYSPDMWHKIIGSFKLTGLIGKGTGLRPRRAGRTTSIAGDSASGFSPQRNFLESAASGDLDAVEELMRTELLEAVRGDDSPAEIVRKFGLEPSAESQIEEYRQSYTEIS